MSPRPESREQPSFGENAYLWTFVPAIVLLSVVVFVVCCAALLISRAKAGF